MKKKALVASILTIALCLSLIAGSTFALFTSESTVNVAVTSGKVKVTATASGLVLSSTLGSNAGGTTAQIGTGAAANTITLDKIVPGDVITFKITIHNESDVTVNYRTMFKKISGNNALFNALKITVTQEGASEEDAPATMALAETDSTPEAPAIATPYGTMVPGCADIVLLVRIELPETVGNELQGKGCKLAYTVEAVQGNADFTTVWDGVAEDTSWYTEELAAQIAAATAENPVIVEISTAAQYAGLVKISNTKTCFKNTVIKLTNDIDLNGKFVDQIGAVGGLGFFSGTFDGQGHAIKGYKIKFIPTTTNYSNTGLFGVLNGATVKNLTIDGADMYHGHSGTGGCGLIAGGVSFENNMVDSERVVVVENVHITNSIIRRCEGGWQAIKIGLFFGFVNGMNNSDVILRNCSIENSAVVNSANDLPLNAWYGLNERAGWTPTLDNSTLTNVIVGSVYGTSYNAETVKLEDILNGTVTLHH